MAFGLSLVALLLTLCAGVGLTQLIGRGESVSLACLCALSIMLGMGSVSFALWTLGFVLSGPILIAVVSIGCVGIGAAGLLVAPIRSFAFSLRKLTLKGTLVTAFLVSAIAWLSIHSTLGFDGLFNWELKGCIAFSGMGRIPAEVYSDPTLRFGHPDYPLFIPLIESWLYTWIQRCDQSFAKLVFAMPCLAAMTFLYSGSQLLWKERWRGFLAIAILATIPFLWLYDGGALSGYADFTLATCYLGAVIFLLRYLRSGLTPHLRTAAALTTMLPWIKQEGAILWACVACLITVAALRHRQFRAIGMVWIPGLALLVAWRLFLQLVNSPGLDDFMPLTFQTLVANVGRIPAIANWLMREALFWPYWGLFWPALVIALVLPGARLQTDERALLAASIAVPFTIYSSLYIFSSWTPFTRHLNSSMPRLMVHLTLVGILAIAAAAPAPRLAFLASREWARRQANASAA
jgi:hypothetical protein